MFGKKLGIGTGIAAALLVVALAVPAGAQRSRAARECSGAAISADPPAWLTGMRVRSEALNRKYGLGTLHAEARRAYDHAAWLVALSVAQRRAQPQVRARRVRR